MIEVTIISHGIVFGGIQITTLEMIDALKDDIKFNAILCENADRHYMAQLILRNVRTLFVPCEQHQMYPVMHINSVEKVRDLIKKSDVIWIVDEVHHVVHGVRKDRHPPIVAHIHSYALVCPWWGASYGFSEICVSRCSINKIILCKQAINDYLYRWSFLSYFQSQVYKQLDLIKGPLDYALWPVRRAHRTILEEIDAFVFPSYSSKNIVLNHVPEIRELSKLTQVIYNPIIVPEDALPKRLTDNKFVVVYPSGMNIMKGFHILLRAIPHVILYDRNIVFILIGLHSSHLKSYLEKVRLIHYFDKVKNNVIVFPKQPRKLLLKTIASSNILVLPATIPDPAPRVVAEALIMGVPVIVSNIGGIKEFVEMNQSGILVEPNNVAQLVNAIIKAKHIKLNTECINEFYKSVFSPIRFKRKFLDLIEKIAHS